jgi:hypothetical protein
MSALDLELYHAVAAGALDDGRRADAHATASQPWMRYDRPARDLAEAGIALSLVAGPPNERVEAGKPVDFVAEVELERPVENLVVGIHIFDGFGTWAFGTNSELLGHRCSNPAAGRYRITFSVDAMLPLGRYSIGLAASDNRPGVSLPLVWYDQLGWFDVVAAPSEPFAGYAYLHPRLTFERVG